MFFVHTHAYCARSDHAGTAVGDHISVQSQTAANGFHASANGRVLVVGDRHLGGPVVRHPLFQVVPRPARTVAARGIRFVSADRLPFKNDTFKVERLDSTPRRWNRNGDKLFAILKL